MLRMGRDSSAGITTRYGLDGPGIESRVGREIFRTHPDRPWGPPSLLYNTYGAFPEVMCPGRGTGNPPSCVVINERVEIYFHSPSGPPWPVSRVNFNFIFLSCYEEYGKVEAKLHAFSRGKRKKFHASTPPPHTPISGILPFHRTPLQSPRHLAVLSTPMLVAAIS